MSTDTSIPTPRNPHGRRQFGLEIATAASAPAPALESSTVNGAVTDDPPETSTSTVLTADQVLSLDTTPPRMLVSKLIPTPGAVLLVGSQKSGKTVCGVQVAVAVASDTALFFQDEFEILDSGAVLIVEKDDPAGAASIKQYLAAARVDISGLPIYIDTAKDLELGPKFLAWLEGEIRSRNLKLIVLDSYTALRPSRKASADIVKVESMELKRLDTLAKDTGSTMLVIHHDSKGSFGMDWSDRTAGSYAVGAAVEGQIHISRFPDLPLTARERLIRFRGRHFEGFEAVLRFCDSSLDYELAMAGSASALFTDILELKNHFGVHNFSPKSLYSDLGISRATAH